MAIGTNGIATREDVNSLKAGTYVSDLKRCVTYNSLIGAGFSVNNVDRYLNNPNRLVRYSDIIQTVVLTFKLVIDISLDATMYNNGPITLDTQQGNLKEMTLTKNNSNINLLESSTYGPAEVSTVDGKKTVTYTLLTETYSTSDITPSTYKLSYTGSGYLKNRRGRISRYNIYASSTSTVQYEIISVNTNSSAEYTFVACLRNITTPIPTYNFRLRFSFYEMMATLYQINVNFTCTIYSSSGAVLGNCSVTNESFKTSELIADAQDSYYYINLWTGDTIPYYVKISTETFKYKTSRYGNWMKGFYFIQNSKFTDSSPSLSGSGVAYTTLNPSNNNYSVDYLMFIM